MPRTKILAALLLLVAVGGCQSSTEQTTVENTDPAASVAPTADEATLVSLQKADLVDGTEDHVIGKCYVCSLGMDGKEEFAVDVHGYKAHLCSSACRDHFEESSESVIASTKIPE